MTLYKRCRDATLRQVLTEVEMRLFLLALGMSMGIPCMLAFPDARPAAAAECTGDNCPPPAGQGHDCKHEKKDETVS